MEPKFTSDGYFRCELVTDKLDFEEYAVVLTICSEDKPVIAFTSELIKTEDKPKKLKASFNEDGFNEAFIRDRTNKVLSFTVPLEDIQLHVIPM